ncbi:MAG: hypothetical protein JNK20_17585 [Flavipsychrobacter sp.]|nr:hypothetical protein [Flavipsychrobacter sp.]
MKIIFDYFATDRSTQLPVSLKLELDTLEEQVLTSNQPVVHKLKSLRSDYPDFPEPACTLARVYHYQGKSRQALDLLLPLNEYYPRDPIVLTSLGEILLELEEFDMMEVLADFSLPFEQQFPHRLSVALEEWLPYEQLVAEWLFVNGEFHLGYDRFRKIIQVLETMPKEFQEFEELIELIDDYLEPEEYDAATHEMLQLLYKKVAGHQYYKQPSFRHPELSILQRELFPEDIPALMQLLQLPRESLLPDLRSAIRDIYINDFYYREFTPESIQPDLALAGFLLLAELEQPGDIEEWISFLRKPADLIEFWMGDFLLEMGHRISWKLGRKDLRIMENALKENFDHQWSAISIAEGLILTSTHEPDKRPEILNIFERTILFILDSMPQRGTENLLPNLLEYGLAMDRERFTPLMMEAYNRMRIVTTIYAKTPEEMLEESTYWKDQPDLNIEYKRSLLSLEQLLTWWLNLRTEDIS